MKNSWRLLLKWFNKYAKWFKFIFIFCVLVFVIYEIRAIAADLKMPLLEKSLTSQNKASILLMFSAGILSLLPMMGSDFVITHLLPSSLTKKDIWQKGWITNTFANIAGIGGLVSAPLRVHFYGTGKPKKEAVLAVSKIEMFLISGFCLQCILVLLLLFVPAYAGNLQKYWPLVLVGASIFPSVYLITKWRAKSFFNNFSTKQQFILFASSSFGWWLSFGAFALIGYCLNENLDLVKLFMIFVIGSAIGMFSLVPGGLGTFDLFVLYSITALGVPKEVVVVWLLFYRFFAYLLPFFSGLILFLPELVKLIPQTIKKRHRHSS